MLLAVVLFSTAAWGAIGPQSIQVTFNGDNVEGWKIIGHGSADLTNQATVSGGLMNVVMNEQNATDHKYRADLKYTTSDVFSFDKSKDKIWAIKVSGTYPGTNSNKCQFELQYKNASGGNTTFTRFTGTPQAMTCSDGVIFYFDLTSKISDYAAIQEGDVSVNLIHFLFADAVITDETKAHYAVDWIATFSSVDELSFYKDWKDEQTNFSEPVFEYCFRPNASSNSYDYGYPKSGVTSQEFEGNYQARIFAVQYYLIDNYSAEKWYTISITNTSASTRQDLALWDFPDKINVSISANDIRTKATSVVGIAPAATEGTTNTPIATAAISSGGGTWTFVIPSGSLTAIGTVGTKTLVGVFITSKILTSSSSGKFASTSNTTVAHPAFAIATIANETQKTVESSLATAVTNANANDVLTISEDITVSARIDIAKALTIQGATGDENIKCGAAGDKMLILANGDGDEHTLTLRNLIIDGQSTSRSIQVLEAAQNANLSLEGIRFVNTTYSVTTGDVKNTGNKNIILVGDNNSIPYGIYLNMNKRINGQYATQTPENPIKIILASDYVEDYATVLCAADPDRYTIEDADGTTLWYLYDGESGSCGHELKPKKIAVFTLNDNADNSSTLTTNNGKVANVTLNRTIARNGTDYATFSAPFAITRSALEYYLGTTEVLRYKRTDIDGEDAILVFDDDVEDLEAGVPYLIKPLVSGEDVTTMTFNGVTIDKTVREAEDTHYRFIPLFSQTNVGTGRSDDKSVVYLGGGNQLYWAQATCNIKGFRAYFEAKNVASPAMKSVRRMSIGRNGAPTAIDDVQSNDTKVQKILRDGQVIIIRDGIEYNAFGQRIQ